MQHTARTRQNKQRAAYGSYGYTPAYNGVKTCINSTCAACTRAKDAQDMHIDALMPYCELMMQPCKMQRNHARMQSCLRIRWLGLV